MELEQMHEQYMQELKRHTALARQHHDNASLRGTERGRAHAYKVAADALERVIYRFSNLQGAKRACWGELMNIQQCRLYDAQGCIPSTEFGYAFDSAEEECLHKIISELEKVEDK